MVNKLANVGIKCCYKCENRSVGCHSTCDQYIAESKARADYKKAIRKEEYCYNDNRVRPRTNHKSRTARIEGRIR